MAGNKQCDSMPCHCSGQQKQSTGGLPSPERAARRAEQPLGCSLSSGKPPAEPLSMVSGCWLCRAKAAASCAALNSSANLEAVEHFVPVHLSG